MDAYRLSAAGGALALHALVLAGVLAFAIAPSMKRPVEPVRVVLLDAPEPLPLARTPLRPDAEPPPRTVAPAAPAAVPAPRPVRPAPAIVRARAAPPAPEHAIAAPLPEPVHAPAAAAEPALAPAQPAMRSNAIATTTTGAAAAAPVVAAATAAGAREPARAGARSAPHVDATWSGNVPPPYPAMARRMGDQGEVRLDVHVDADGAVTEVRLRQSSGSTLLDRTAIDTVRRWRFKPATIDGQPVAEWYHDWRWVFRLEG